MALLQGITNWLTKPASTADGTSTPNAQRMGRYNQLRVENEQFDYHVLVDEGSYFVSTNPTPGTAIAATTSITSYATTDTQPLMTIANTGNSGGPNIYLDYLKLIQGSVLMVAATNCRANWNVDLLATRNPSGGSAITPVNLSALSGQSPVAAIRFGALTTVAGGGINKLISMSALRPAVTTAPAMITGDEFLFKFGGIEQAASNVISSPTVLASPGTTVSAIVRNVIPVPPIVIPPGYVAILKVWGTSNGSAQTYEFEMGHFER